MHTKNNSISNIEEKSIDTSAEHIRQLEDENLRLRIENAYLKELRRLRLEEEAIEKYIKYYNDRRIKEKLGWMSPVQYLLNTLAA